MTKKIFRSFMLSAVAVLLAGVVIVMTCLYSYFASVQESQLQDQLQLAAAAVETEGTDYLKGLTAEGKTILMVSHSGSSLPCFFSSDTLTFAGISCRYPYGYT